jgi:hypothetical protein
MVVSHERAMVRHKASHSQVRTNDCPNARRGHEVGLATFNRSRGRVGNWSFRLGDRPDNLELAVWLQSADCGVLNVC